MTIHVVYIAGVGRSGSTVLDRVLGTLPGVVSFNEIYRIFLEGFEENNLCACGARFDACEFWRAIVDKTISGPGDVEHLAGLHQRLDHSRHFLKIYSRLHGRQFSRDLKEYRDWLRTLYLELASVSGADVIVDSSKVPTHALLLQGIADVKVHVVHVVRDVRAIVNAWMKKKHNPAAGHALPVFSPRRTVTYWSARNLLSEMLRSGGPYTRIYYEDFALQPQVTLDALIKQVEPLQGKRLEFQNADTVNLTSLHTIGGNPDRFTSGPTKISLDLSWSRKLDPKVFRTTTRIAYPLLARYGYTGVRSPENLSSKLADNHDVP